jgi:non-canonical (house-cleaning) NTP pyrophosphatase
MDIALGSARAAKINAVRDCVQRIAKIDPAWANAEIIARAVNTEAPAMPLSDEQLMRGARERSEAVMKALRQEGRSAGLYVGLEGGFHSVELDGKWQTFLRGWAYTTDGECGFFGATPSIVVPDSIARRVIEGGIELRFVIDEVAGETDVRSRQGAWGVLSRDLLTRSMSFESALLAAFAPFYNPRFYR